MPRRAPIARFATIVQMEKARGYADTSDRPFALPPRELVTTVVDLPIPPSVNQVRRMSRAGYGKLHLWHEQADRMMMFIPKAARRPVPGKFELHITLSEAHTRIDLDNGIKALIDYLRRIELIVDDSPKYLRRLVVEWCHPAVAPQGCRVTIIGLAL